MSATLRIGNLELDAGVAHYAAGDRWELHLHLEEEQEERDVTAWMWMTADQATELRDFLNRVLPADGTSDQPRTATMKHRWRDTLRSRYFWRAFLRALGGCWVRF